MDFLEKSYIEFIDEKIELGKSLVDKLECDFIAIDGALKTKRNIEKEIKFLQKVLEIFPKIIVMIYSFFLPAQNEIPRWMRWTGCEPKATMH